jgi:hypothetical protein
MTAQIVDLAISLGKLVPNIKPRLEEALQQQLPADQTRFIKNAPPQQANIPLQPGRPGMNSGPGLRFISGPSAPVSEPVNRKLQLEQTIVATHKTIAHQQFKSIVLSVAEERRNEGRVIFYFLCACFALGLIILTIGILLLFQKNPGSPSPGDILTALGGILSGVGGVLVSVHQNINKNLDDLIEKIKDA